ncbi:MAG: TIGR03936 family radical SAM-associated protein [Propionibacteriaceae bacterium]|nr:TIGR03936 family radical SAM-associated protein [Propionibacteriaceae bacterium]
MRFASHRDFARCFERGLRRAGIPMAYSSGFHPHQRVSYVNPAPTGAASEAEFLVIAVREMVDAADAHARLDCVMPRGFPILKVSTMETERHFDASEWEVTLPGCEEDSLREAVGRFVQAPTAEVSRLTKKGVRTFDAKPPVLALEMAGTNILRMVIRHDEPLVRPDDIVTALRQMGTLPDIPALTTRLNQGALYDLVSVDPVLGK